MQASKFFPLASWMAESSLSTWKSLTKTNPARPMSSIASFSRLNCFFLLMLLLLLWCFLRALMELREWDRKIEWIASLSLSWRSQIFSRIASISSSSKICLRLYDALVGYEVCVCFSKSIRKFGFWILSLGAENLDWNFVFDVLVVWGFEIWVWIKIFESRFEFKFLGFKFARFLFLFKYLMYSCLTYQFYLGLEWD